MNLLEAKIIRGADGQTYTVTEHKSWQDVLDPNNIIYFEIAGEHKGFKYLTVFENGLVRLVDDALQQRVIDEIKEAREAQEALRRAQEEANRAARDAREAVPARRVAAGRNDAIVPAAIIGAGRIVAGEYYGTRARDIYDKCVAEFGFSATLAGQFGMQQQLYAQDASRENYSVWMLAHNSWIEDGRNVPANNWRNTIRQDRNIIIEEWDNTDIPGFLGDRANRIVFAKHSQMYMFLGVYECSGIDENEHTKTYTRIAEVYPIQV